MGKARHSAAGRGSIAARTRNLAPVSDGLLLASMRSGWTPGFALARGRGMTD